MARASRRILPAGIFGLACMIFPAVACLWTTMAVSGLPDEMEIVARNEQGRPIRDALFEVYVAGGRGVTILSAGLSDKAGRVALRFHTPRERALPLLRVSHRGDVQELRRRGGAAYPSWTTALPLSEEDFLELTLRPAHRVSVKVVSAEGGRPITGAQVAVSADARDGGGGNPIATGVRTDTSGEATLHIPSPQDVEAAPVLDVSAAGYLSRRTRLRASESRVEVELHPLESAVPLPRTVRVNAVDRESDQPLVGSVVEAGAVDGSDIPTVRTWTDSAGDAWFTIDRSWEGRFRIAVEQGGYQARSDTVTVDTRSKETITRRMQMRRLWAHSRVHVQVVTADGAPLEDAIITIAEGDSVIGRTRTDGQGFGRCDVRHRPGTAMSVRASHPLFEDTASEIRDGDPPHVELTAFPALNRVVFVLNLARRIDQRTFAANARGVATVLECFLSSPRDYRVGVVTWSDDGPRPLIRGDGPLTVESIRGCIEEMGFLRGYGGALNAGELADVARHVSSSMPIGSRGCDVVVIMPEDVTIERAEGIEHNGMLLSVCEVFMEGNLRLNILEISKTLEGDDRAMREMCEKTGGLYRRTLPGHLLQRELIAIYQDIVARAAGLGMGRR